MGNQRRTYTKEFKLETLKLAETSEKSVSQIEREMGLPAGVIFRWQRQLRQDGGQAFPGHGNLKEAETRIEQLEKENANLRMERDILKKAVRVFSQGQK
jgi:transposase